MSKLFKNSSKIFTSLSLVVLILSFVLPQNVHAAVLSSHKYIVQLKQNDSSIFSADASIKNIQPIFTFNNTAKFSNTYKFQSTKSLDQLSLNLNDKFISLDEDQIIKVGATTAITTLPNDPGLTTKSTNVDKQWGLVKAGFLDAWKKTSGNKSVVVAVVDTGIDGSHEDLRGTRLVSGYDVVTESRISGHSNSDDNGHGTLISGVIAAATNNNIGIAGAAPNVSVMPVKALDTSGAGTSSQISEAIVWATDHGADVINLSLGGIGFGHDKVLANAISYAFDKNVVIVSAAGNDVAVTGGNLDISPVFPICDDNGKNMIIGVTATDSNDLKPSFANYGKACIDVSAPGKRILSTINHDPATGVSAPDSYAYASGTSLAVPFVSAQAALLRSLYPDATNRQIRDRIITTSENIDNLNISQCAGQSCKGLLGGGRINVAKSLEEQIVKIVDGDLIKLSGTNTIYYINGGKKQLVSPFVKNQRFANVTPRVVPTTDLDSILEGSYAEAADGTLVKSPNDPAVYYMESGLRRPLTYQVFTMRGFKFSDVVTLTNVEVGSWIVGSLFTPPDGTILRSKNKPAIYWVVNGSLRPVNYQFYISNNLNRLPINYVSDGDITKFPKGDAYIL